MYNKQSYDVYHPYRKIDYANTCLALGKAMEMTNDLPRAYHYYRQSIDLFEELHEEHKKNEKHPEINEMKVKKEKIEKLEDVSCL
jgi:hypothetical protein